MAASNNVPSGCDPNGGFTSWLACGSGTAADSQGQSANSLFAALYTAAASLGVQALIFVLIRQHLARIYRPRSYLVPEKDRVEAPPAGILGWIKPLFNTSNLSFIQKCGLDAYFFLRYLRMLLKIFLPMAAVLLPILLPINNYSGNGTGLNKLSIANVAPRYTSSRLWAHLLAALGVVIWVCYVAYKELRGYIRVRQAFLTSPQHRIRASATTVLVTGIPQKWLTLEALNGLYDVFPGGIRNVWINRNFDSLADKVDYRNSLAESLEDAETNLVKMCRKKHDKAEEKKRKEQGKSKKTKKQRQEQQAVENAEADRMAQGDGTSAGDQHHTTHGLEEALHEAEEAENRRSRHELDKRKLLNPLGLVGQGFGAVERGFEGLGRGVGKVGRGVDNGFQKAGNEIDRRANYGDGFVVDDELYRSPSIRYSDVPPTPPPKTPIEEREERLASLQHDGSFDQRAQPPTNTPHQEAYVNGGPYGTSPRSERTQMPPSIRVNGPSMESKPRSQLQIELPDSQLAPQSKWKFWQNHDRSLLLPSPRPHTNEEDEFPLTGAAARASGNGSGEKLVQGNNGSKWTDKLAFWRKNDQKDVGETSEEVYPEAFKMEESEDQDGNAYWRRFIEPKERETMRLPLLTPPTWVPSLPLIGKKVDRIYWLRKELARMNLEIEMDQNEPEKFPYMNSAFIQFNHQVAAHMACQSLSHHIPQHMAPRHVEISPDDVIWDNMAIKWWERYIRSAIVLVISIALIIFYAIPVTFSSLLSKVSTLAQFPGLKWLATIPEPGISFIQGVLPPLVLAIILALVPIIFGALVEQQGVPTGTGKELGVQQWYFVFLFIQVFLVVTITGGLTSVLTDFANNPASIFNILANSLPKASNYFFNYLTVQALSSSASALLQVSPLITWFLLAPILDSTARAKWRRQTTLQDVQWGSFFPPFTNFAVIGIIYSVIAPMILVFMLVIFALFWLVYCYNVLYVFQFRNDTGGLLFPAAVNQLFVGLYVMELCLIGFFFIARDASGNAGNIPQAIIMIVALVFTIAFQWLLNSAFRPLFEYLPITLEDEAVIRDEEFARAQASKFAPLRHEEDGADERDRHDLAGERERREQEEEDRHLQQQHRNLRERASFQGTVGTGGTQSTSPRPWHHNNQSNQPSWHADRWRKSTAEDVMKIRNSINPNSPRHRVADEKNASSTKLNPDVEAQNTVGDVLFSGFADELEDLTPDERDLLVRYAFQHSALRAKRPVVWIPRDRLGVSDDEIRRAERMSTVQVHDGEKGGTVAKTNIWMSNEGTALDGKGNVVFRRSPPDFSNVDLIAL